MGGYVGRSDAFTVHEGPRRTGTAGKATAEGQRQNLLSTKGREGPRRAAKNVNCNCRTATATPFSTEDTKGHGERQLQDRQLLRVNGKTFYPRRAAKNVNCNCRTATATPFSTEDTKGHGERQLQEGQLQKVNGKNFYPRRAAKDREGPRRTSTATAELQRLHLFPRRTRRATGNGNCRIGNY